MFEAFVLGLVQGLGEFLPISSSAHLIVFPWLFGWEDQGLAFDVALHWATLIAVVAYFRKDIWHLARGFWHSLWPGSRNFSNNVYQRLSWMLLIATAPAALIGMYLEPVVESAFRNPLIPVVTMAVFGAVLLVADHVGRKQKNLDQISKKAALLIGLSQAIALIPGVSRSGSTITAGLFLGLKRDVAARFSFLLAIPITFGAGLLKLPDIAHIQDIPALSVGFVTALVTAFLSIKYLLRYIGRKDYSLFVWYRWLFSVAVIAIYLLR